MQKDLFPFAGHLTCPFILASPEELCMPFNICHYEGFLFVREKAVYCVQFHIYLSVYVHICIMYLACFSEDLRLTHVFTSLY